MGEDPPPAPVVEREGADASSLIHPTDLRLALFILSVCAYLYWVTTEFEQVADMFAQDVGPEFFPRLLLWTIVLLSLALPFEHLFLKEKRKGIDKNRKSRIEPMTYVTAGLLIATVASIPWLGSILSMVAICILLPMLWGERRAKVLVPFAVIFPAGITFLFAYLLGVHFEPGVFDFTIR
jgi:putative tricarboxylic transport membrane protein